MKTYYKVVTTDSIHPDIFTSAVMHDPHYCVFYKLNEWSRPVIGKLFVYTSLTSAELFCTDITRQVKYKIFECECENPVIPGFTKVVDINLYSIYTTLEFTIETFWKYFHSFDGWAVPHGTMMCDAVKLIREIPIK